MTTNIGSICRHRIVSVDAARTLDSSAVTA